MKQITKILGTILMAVFATGLLHANTDIGILPSATVVGVAGLIIPMPQGTLNGLVLETWGNYIIERFYKDNQFLRNAYDDSAYVLQGRIVHIPQVGSKPVVQKNRTVFPATAVRRTDTEVLYALDEYTTDPTHIPNIDAVHLSYNKQDSVLGDHMIVLNETVADDMLIKWGANGTIFRTTGNGPTGTVGPVAGQTGNRLGFHHKDLSRLMIAMNADSVPKNDRYVLIDDNMFGFFYDSLSDTQSKDFSRYMDAENGVIGKLHSFNIMTRSSVLAATNANAVKALGSALAATDNLASFAWQKNSVAFCIGDHSLYQDTNNPLYYGDIHSCLVMAGGRVRRGDGKGVYVIAQGV